MTNKSKELAELLGIEPIRFFACNAISPCIPEMECRNCQDSITIRKVYPDFEKPENFVKLLELLYNQSSNLLYDSYNFTVQNKSFLSNFLYELRWELNNRKDIAEKFPENEVNEEMICLLEQAQKIYWSY